MPRSVRAFADSADRAFYPGSAWSRAEIFLRRFQLESRGNHRHLAHVTGAQMMRWMLLTNGISFRFKLSLEGL